jgi:hypothetical protein
MLILCFVCVPAKEGNVSFAVENLWTTFKDPDIDSWQLRHIRFRSRYAPVSNVDKEYLTNQTWHFTGERWHLGFPCWALYIDNGTAHETTTKYSLKPKVWYAKLDLYRLLVNIFVGTVAGLGLRSLYRLFQTMISKKKIFSSNFTQIKSFGRIANIK